MSAIRSRRAVDLVLVFAGSVVGVLHIWMAISAIVVFRHDEPISSWVTMLAGPCSTLLATWGGGFRPRLGAIWLIGGAVVSFLFFLPGGKHLFPFFLTIFVPMMVLGICFLLLYKTENSSESNKRDEGSQANGDVPSTT